jgi:hypothetical protein
VSKIKTNYDTDRKINTLLTKNTLYRNPKCNYVFRSWEKRTLKSLLLALYELWVEKGKTNLVTTQSIIIEKAHLSHITAGKAIVRLEPDFLWIRIGYTPAKVSYNVITLNKDGIKLMQAIDKRINASHEEETEQQITELTPPTV